jgi:hypothetical protein
MKELAVAMFLMIPGKSRSVMADFDPAVIHTFI